MASSTRSAFRSNSLPATSRISMRPSAPFTHSTRAQTSASIAPAAPIARLVTTAKSRVAPSSCEVEVRSFSGQSGQVSALFSFTGGCGMISSCVTEAAPWRIEVPMQSDPVSPPPITTTCLPAALSVPFGAACASPSPATRLFCWTRNSIAKWMPERPRPSISRSRGRSAPPANTMTS